MSSAASTGSPAAEPGDGAPRRPLSVVPLRAARRSRVSTVVMCTLALAAALVGILLLNIQITQGQYELTELTGQERALSQENEALTQDIEADSAPQNLAARANDLGMVPAKDIGSVDLATGAVTPPENAAQKSDPQNILVPPAEMKGSDAAQKNRAAAEERAEKRAKEEAEKKTAEREAQRKADEARDLNGGSIPAPSQRAPGH